MDKEPTIENSNNLTITKAQVQNCIHNVFPSNVTLLLYSRLLRLQLLIAMILMVIRMDLRYMLMMDILRLGIFEQNLPVKRKVG